MSLIRKWMWIWPPPPLFLPICLMVPRPSNWDQDPICHFKLWRPSSSQWPLPNNWLWEKKNDDEGHFVKSASSRRVWKFFLLLAFTLIFEWNFVCISFTHPITKIPTEVGLEDLNYSNTVKRPEMISFIYLFIWQ